MPVTPLVQQTWGLSPRARGVMVVSVQPGGIAASHGIQPGDVLIRVRGADVARPVDLDSAVLFWVKQGVTDLDFDGYRGNAIIHPRAKVSRSGFDAIVDLAKVATWLAAPAAPRARARWNYGDYYSTYRPSVERSYRAAPAYIEREVPEERYRRAATSYQPFEVYESRPVAVGSYTAVDNGRYVDFDGSSYNLGSNNNNGINSGNTISSNSGNATYNITNNIQGDTNVSDNRVSVDNSDRSTKIDASDRSDRSTNTDASDNRSTDNSDNRVTDNSIDASDRSSVNNSNETNVSNNETNNNSNETNVSNNETNNNSNETDLPTAGPAVITRVHRFDIRVASPAQARRT
jgi:hypothetical protein